MDTILLADENVDIVYSGFNSVISDLFNECFPVKNRHSKPIYVQKLCIDDYVKGLITLKCKILKLYKKPSIMYRDIRNTVNSVAQSSLINYY